MLAEIWILVFLWLGICLVFDWRTREIPLAWTIAPLVLACLYGAWRGYWMLSVEILILIVISDLPAWARRIIACCVIVAACWFARMLPQGIPIALWIGILWFIWDLSRERVIIAPSDIRILWTLMLLLLRSEIALIILLAMALQAAIYLVLRKQEAPLMPSIVAGTLLFMVFVK